MKKKPRFKVGDIVRVREVFPKTRYEWKWSEGRQFEITEVHRCPEQPLPGFYVRIDFPSEERKIEEVLSRLDKNFYGGYFGKISFHEDWFDKYEEIPKRSRKKTTGRKNS